MSQYESFANEYALHAAQSPYNTEYERPAMLAQLPDLVGRHVLDVACATGEYIPFLLDRGAHVTAVDESGTFVAAVRERFDERVVTAQADLNDGLPFMADGCVDVILSSLTLHYIADWDRLLREFFRVCKPGGTLLISTHHPAQIADLVDNYFQTQSVDDRWSIAGKDTAVRYFHRPLQAMIAPLVSAGFTIAAILEPECAQQPGRPWFLIIKSTK